MPLFAQLDSTLDGAAHQMHLCGAQLILITSVQSGPVDQLEAIGVAGTSLVM